MKILNMSTSLRVLRNDKIKINKMAIIVYEVKCWHLINDFLVKWKIKNIHFKISNVF
jgi:hypothetical protein